LSKSKVLFIVRSYGVDAPIGIRFKNIIKYLTDEYDVHILAYDYMNERTKTGAVKLHLLQYSFLSKILNKNYFFSQYKNTIFGKAMGLLNIIVRKWMYPDDFIIEKNKIINKVIELNEKYNYRVVIGAAYPFTMFEIGQELKKNELGFKWIVDIGDPFAENSTHNFTKSGKIKAEKYEESNLSFSDAIVVTNLITKKMYKNKYKTLDSKNIVIIPQGTDLIEDYGNHNSGSHGLKLIYAGVFYPQLREPYQLFKAIDECKEKVRLDIYGQPNIYGVKNDKIKFRGRVSHEEIFNAYNSANVLVFIDNAFGLQSSGKIFELISMKKPILFISDNINSPTLELIGEHNFIIQTKNNASDIKIALENIEQEKNKFVFDFNMETVSWEERARRYRKLLDELLDEEKK